MSTKNIIFLFFILICLIGYLSFNTYILDNGELIEFTRKKLQEIPESDKELFSYIISDKYSEYPSFKAFIDTYFKRELSFAITGLDEEGRGAR